MRRATSIAAVLSAAFVAACGSVSHAATLAHAPGMAGPPAHTHVRILRPAATPSAALSGQYETPASLACVYGLTPYVNGCNPASASIFAAAGSRAIAVVDAFHYASAASDLAVFTAQFGLPAADLVVVYASGVQPSVDQTGGWQSEAALDIQAVHGLSPYARIYLVETASDSLSDLMQGVSVATSLVQAAGGGQVSMSWGSGEDPSYRTQWASYFKAPQVTYFAAAGDVAGPEFPSDISSVVAAGGTSIHRDAGGNYLSQTAWSSTGGGRSAVTPRPGYQQGQIPQVGLWRGMPDWSFDADPNSGMWVYDSVPVNRQSGWAIMGGTSLSSPALAALSNSAGHFYGQSEHVVAYSHPGSFVDIRDGRCLNANGGTSGASATAGWDLCTGLGYPYGATAK